MKLDENKICEERQNEVRERERETERERERERDRDRDRDRERQRQRELVCEKRKELYRQVSRK